MCFIRCGLQVEADDPDYGATSLIAPFGEDGSSMLLASSAKRSVIEAAWAMYRAALDVSRSITANASSTAPRACHAKSSSAWNFIANAMSGAQVRVLAVCLYFLKVTCLPFIAGSRTLAFFRCARVWCGSRCTHGSSA